MSFFKLSFFDYLSKCGPLWMCKYWFRSVWRTFHLNDVLSFMISRALLVFQGLTGQSENQDPGEVQDLEDSKDHMDHQEFQWVGTNYLLFKLTWLRLGLPLRRVKQNVLCRGNIRKMGSSKESFWTRMTKTIFPRNIDENFQGASGANGLSGAAGERGIKVRYSQYRIHFIQEFYGGQQCGILIMFFTGFTWLTWWGWAHRTRWTTGWWWFVMKQTLGNQNLIVLLVK